MGYPKEEKDNVGHYDTYLNIASQASKSKTKKDVDEISVSSVPESVKWQNYDHVGSVIPGTYTPRNLNLQLDLNESEW